MSRILALVALFVAMFAALMLPGAARAEPADISAAARGVVRVVIVGTDGEKVFPTSHGSGFAVSPTRIVTNAHVVREAQQDDTLRIAVVPSEGDDAAYARIVAVNPRNDLALIEIVEGLRLPPLTVAGGSEPDAGEVTSVGYPMNVDRAQGLDIGDIFKSQPPVKSRGFLSGARPSRQFDTILHTASIARGNSGGPLLDGCGRVLGVNSFGAESGSSDAEFFFAVSTRELLPFLADNGVEARVNALPCRSLAELDADERARLEDEQSAARARMAARAAEARDTRERALLEAEMAVMEERENAMAFAALLLLVALGAGAYAFRAKQREGGERAAMIAGALAGIATIAALALWFTRPGLADIDRRVAGATQAADDGEETGDTATQAGNLLCTLDVTRSRVTGAKTDDVALDWTEDGCVNGRTQYGFASGEWSRVFVPNDEDAVLVNVYEPANRTFRTDRYLLGRSQMAAARAERGKYRPPSCAADASATTLGEMQAGVLGLLPDRPNERLIYTCQASRK